MGDLKRVDFSREGIRVTHLLFFDNCLIFSRSKILEWLKIQSLLDAYERALGQFLNKEKTTILFNSNTDERVRGKFKW